MKLRMKSSILAGTLGLSVLFAGCSTQQQPTNTSSSTASNGSSTQNSAVSANPTNANASSASSVTLVRKSIKIAVVSEYTDDEWSSQFLSGINATAKQFGATLITTDAQHNREQMVSQMDAIIGQHPNVIIVNHGDASALKPEVVKAIQAGIKVITSDVSIDVPGLTSQLSQDDYSLALLSLEKMIQDINGEGNIVVIWVGGYAPMEKRMKILQVMESEYPNIHVVSQFGNATNTTFSDTMSRTEAVLRAHPGDIKAIWASWDQFALGAEQAVQSLNSKVPVYSIDLSTQDISKMRNSGSTWIASAGTDVYEYGAVAMKYAVGAAYDQPVPRYYLMPGALVTDNNLPSGGSIHDWFAKTYPDQEQIGLTPALQSLLSK